MADEHLSSFAVANLIPALCLQHVLKGVLYLLRRILGALLNLTFLWRTMDDLLHLRQKKTCIIHLPQRCLEFSKCSHWCLLLLITEVPFCCAWPHMGEIEEGEFFSPESIHENKHPTFFPCSSMNSADADQGCQLTIILIALSDFAWSI